MERDRQGFEHISTIISRALSQVPTGPYLPEPPFDSPIETVFAESCFKFLSPDVDVGKQVEVSTNHGVFRLDFLMSVNDSRIAIECDGKEFHEGLRDDLRDAILLGEGSCETIYHFSGHDLVYYPYDCVWLISVLDKDLFSQRGHIQVPRLRCLTSDVSDEDAERKERFFFNDVSEGGVDRKEMSFSNIDPPSRFFSALRCSVRLAYNNPTLHYHWKALYKFACEYPNTSLDELISKLETTSVTADL